MKYYHKVEKTWQEAYINREQMCALINGWDRWEPDNNLKKGKELLSTNWTIIEINKKARAKREGGTEDKDDDGWDDEDGYRSDKYSNVEDIQYELDNPNLKKVTGLKKLVGEESDDEEEEDGECNKEVGAGKIGGDKGEDDVGAEKEA